MSQRPSGLRLLKAALRGVRIIACPRCKGEGEIGLSSFRTTCPRCRGCGMSTNGINIEQVEVSQ